MKQLIVPVAIIVALIAFFVVMDRKDFNHCNDVQAVKSESSTTIRKPTVPDPQTTAVIETNPSVELKSMTEAKPKTDTKPAEVKPVAETKTIETKLFAATKQKPEPTPATEVKPSETLSEAEAKSAVNPTAVPVATMEEAIRANENALKLLSKVETNAPSKDIKSVAETKKKTNPFLWQFQFLPEEAIKSNKEAIRFQRNKAIAKAFSLFFHKIGLNNRIHFVFSCFR